MKIPSLDTPIATRSQAPEPAKPHSSLSETLKKVIGSEIQSHFPQSLHPEERTALAETLLKAISAEIYSHLPTAMSMFGNKGNPQSRGPSHELHRESSQEKAKGAGMAVAGAAMQGIGQRIGNAGGLGAKLFGASLSFAGKVAEEHGKDTLINARGEAGRDGPNAFAGFYRGLGTPQPPK
ncbi:hypothetical protein [Pseudomonas sp.]|uniref:hypothetical protein n=1 Tax=Pseudomonas sp. TaxID=306 RepID=UPI0026335949|nr:hypothetical protein [Pseudomonas sp.]